MFFMDEDTWLLLIMNATGLFLKTAHLEGIMFSIVRLM